MGRSIWNNLRNNEFVKSPIHAIRVILVKPVLKVSIEGREPSKFK